MWKRTALLSIGILCGAWALIGELGAWARCKFGTCPPPHDAPPKLRRKAERDAEKDQRGRLIAAAVWAVVAAAFILWGLRTPYDDDA
jgi:hypothetical protein